MIDSGSHGSGNTRRNFLKRVSQSALAVPAICSSGALALVESTAIAQSRKVVQATSAKPALTLNVRDYGAMGDGTTKDTVALQQTIDRCWVFGGGEVVVPAGNYFTGADRKSVV